jgi:hypothetical protein
MCLNPEASKARFLFQVQGSVKGIILFKFLRA